MYLRLLFLITDLNTQHLFSKSLQTCMVLLTQPAALSIANGAAERAVRTVKNLLGKSEDPI